MVRRRHEIEVVAANDLLPIDEVAYFLRHDSVHGPAPAPVAGEDGVLHFGPLDVRLLHERDPAQIGWAEAGVDVVLECTGRFTKGDAARAHLSAGGPRRVVVGAPCKAARTVVVGVNEDDVTAEDDLVSNASCTTNALAPVLLVLERTFGMRWAVLGTVHAYTGAQHIVDAGGAKDLRRGRAGAVNIAPTSTGAAKAVVRVLPELAGKLTASAVRVPVPDGSLYEVTCMLRETADLERVLDALRAAAETDELRGVLEVTDEPLVSTDIVGAPASSIVDAGACLSVGPLLKIVGWYDNELAYAARLLDLVAHIGGRA